MRNWEWLYFIPKLHFENNRGSPKSAVYQLIKCTETVWWSVTISKWARLHYLYSDDKLRKVSKKELTVNIVCDYFSYRRAYFCRA